MIVGFDSYKDKYDFTSVTGVIHVGAHEGQEYEDYVLTFGHIKTHWFEPLSKPFSVMGNRIWSAGGVSLYKYALGAKEGRSKIWIDEGNAGQSSSLLKPKEVLNEWDHIKFDLSEEIEVKSLDSFEIKNSNVLVLDVQGYELEVLKGAEKTLEVIDHIFSEINSKEMYEGCPTVKELDEFLTTRGFSLKENWWTSNNWGDGYWSRF